MVRVGFFPGRKLFITTFTVKHFYCTEVYYTVCLLRHLTVKHFSCSISCTFHCTAVFCTAFFCIHALLATVIRISTRSSGIQRGAQTENACAGATSRYKYSFIMARGGFVLTGSSSSLHDDIFSTTFSVQSVTVQHPSVQHFQYFVLLYSISCTAFCCMAFYCTAFLSHHLAVQYFSSSIPCTFYCTEVFCTVSFCLHALLATNIQRSIRSLGVDWGRQGRGA